MLDSSFEYKIMLKRNVLATNEDFAWYDYLSQLFGEDSRFSVLIRTVDDWGGEEIKRLPIIDKKDRDFILKTHIGYVKSKGLVCENDMVDNGISFGEQFCYAAYPKNYVFRANGEIQKCTVALNHGKNTVGKILKNKVFIDETINQCWTPTLQEDCISCKRILSCMNKQCPEKILFHHVPVCCQLGRCDKF